MKCTTKGGCECETCTELDVARANAVKVGRQDSTKLELLELLHVASSLLRTSAPEPLCQFLHANNESHVQLRIAQWANPLNDRDDKL